ncbi:O-antigen ligase family protein [Hazenella sp. IB182357]|uniref:O-antigen ligase family protein n=1 Tax=Polycladospora coralii TaxID=2771432 RepID=A0A926RTY8_9BACL|nr:O-antigen ligase family protein [Polycladospora coralii]MBD1373365.1 O-antigen ligase family protein [Polycladospora coralii]
MDIENDRKIIQNITRLLYISILISPFLPPVVMLLIGILTVFYQKKNGLNSFQYLPDRIFLGFILLSILGWLIEPHLVMGIPTMLLPVFFYGLYYLLSIWIRDVVDWSWQDIQKMYMFFWICGLFIAVVVILQRVDWEVINQSPPLKYILDFYSYFRWQANYSERSVGTSGNSNLAAALLICLALLSIFALSVLKNMRQKIGAFAIFIVFCIAIMCTGSRGAWGGLVIGLIVQLWMTGHRKRTVVISLSILGSVFLFPQLIPRKDTLASTLDDRLVVWSTAFDIFKENWILGTLPLRFGELAEQAGVKVFHAHNIFLGIATEYGIIGLFLFLALILSTIYRARRWRKTANKKEEKRLAGMLISQTIAILGHGMYDYPIIAPQIGVLFILSIIIIHTQYEKRCVKRPAWSEGDDIPKETTLLQALSSFIVSAKVNIKSFRSK